MAFHLHYWIKKNNIEHVFRQLPKCRAVTAAEVGPGVRQAKVVGDVLHVKLWKKPVEATRDKHGVMRKKAAPYSRLVFLRGTDGVVFVVSLDDAMSRVALCMRDRRLVGRRVVIVEPTAAGNFLSLTQLKARDAFVVIDRPQQIVGQPINLSEAEEGLFTPFVHVGPVQFCDAAVEMLCGGTACDGTHSLGKCWGISDGRGKGVIGLTAELKIGDLFGDLRSVSSLKLFVAEEVFTMPRLTSERFDVVELRDKIDAIAALVNFEILGWMKPSKLKEGDVACVGRIHVCDIRVLDDFSVSEQQKYNIAMPQADPPVQED